MWTSLTNIFKKREKKDDTGVGNFVQTFLGDDVDFPSVVDEPAVNAIGELTENSPRRPTPPNTGITLWMHQQAMLARCIEIEAANRKASVQIKNAYRYQNRKDIPYIQNVSIGIMNDPPGCGKTYVMLALIAQDIKPGLNVIIAPQNIYSQWSSAIKTIYNHPDAPKYKFCSTYADIIDLYGNKRAFESYAVVLVNELYAETIAQSIYDNEIAVNRVIIDEIDSVESRMSTPIKSNHVWLVSASFVYEGSARAGPYSIEKADIPYVVCKCDQAFIEKNVVIELPTQEKIMCDDHELMALKGIVNDEVFNSLNSGDIRLFVKSLRGQYPVEDHNIEGLSSHLLVELLANEADVDEYEGRLRLIEEATEGGEGGEADDYYRLKYTGLVNHHRRLVEQGRELKRRIAELVPSVKTKMETFIDDICQRIKVDPASRWIIFNDNMSALIDVQVILKELGIAAEMMDGGDAAAIGKTIAAYKDGAIQVLLLNSRVEGAGMNLENTTHLLFMHATEGRLVDQVVGRAQRYGRKGRLHIIGLFNKNENSVLQTAE